MSSLQSSLKNIVTKLLKKTHKSVYRRDPLGDWQKIVIFFVWAGLIVIGLAAYLFYEINNGTLFVGEGMDSKSVPALDVSHLKQVNGIYDLKQQKLDALSVSGTSTISIDPSL